MLFRLKNGGVLQEGDTVHRYDREKWSVCEGIAVSVGDTVKVDFGDDCLSFCKDDIFYAIDSLMGEDEKWVTLKEGEMVTDYRSN